MKVNLPGNILTLVVNFKAIIVKSLMGWSFKIKIKQKDFFLMQFHFLGNFYNAVYKGPI